MKKESYHFIGLGGIGMSALARILLQHGHEVQGSDAQESPLLHQLRKEGALVQIGHGEDVSQATVIYSTDIKEHNSELVAAKKKGLPLLHRSELLDHLMKGKKPLLVTGTHGKTTTAALLASTLLEAGLDPSFVVGGILLSLQCNGKAGKGEFFIAEADESDGSFLKSPSFGAIVTNLENDHLDYWQSEKRLDEAFHQFCSQVGNNQHLFWCADDERLLQLRPNGISYGFSESAELKIRNFRPTERGSTFDLLWRGERFEGVEVALFGKHNARNAAAVFGLGRSLGLEEALVRSAFQKFAGTQRRLEFKGEAQRLWLFDDYAHHPTEIEATLQALRDKVRERRLVAIFQPHRFTRTRDQWALFAKSFEEADEVFLTDIYGAREAPIEGITSEKFYEEMKKILGRKLRYFPRETLENDCVAHLQPLDAVLLLGAGDITAAGNSILEKFANLAPKIRVGVLCGGTSVEHEVSLRSGKTVVEGLDPSVYEVEVFGIDKKGRWQVGPESIAKLEQSQESPANPISPQIVERPNQCDVCVPVSPQIVERPNQCDVCVPVSPQIVERLNQCDVCVPVSPQIVERLNQCDVCVPVFHGPEGEDGVMQGLLEALQIPYVGCDVPSAALCMNKAWTKQIAISHNIPTSPFVEIDAVSFWRDPRKLLKQIDERQIRYPVYIKPSHLGSSIGVARATTPEEVLRGARAAFELDDLLIVEQEILGCELEVAVLGNDYVRVAVPAQVMHSGLYTYEDKYGKEPSEKRVPAPISPSAMQLIRELTERTYRALGCKGLARVDFFLDRDGYPWLNEVNPFPGFTSASGYPKMFKACGLSIPELCDQFVLLALQRSRKMAKIRGR